MVLCLASRPQQQDSQGPPPPTGSCWVPLGATRCHQVPLGPITLSIPAPTATLPAATLGTRVWWLHGCHCHPWQEGAGPPSPRGMAGAPPAPCTTLCQWGWPGTSLSRGAVGTPWVRAWDQAPGWLYPSWGHTQPQSPDPPPCALPGCSGPGSPSPLPGPVPGPRDEQLLCPPLKGALCAPGPTVPSTTRHRRHGHRPAARTSQPVHTPFSSCPLPRPSSSIPWGELSLKPWQTPPPKKQETA